MDDGEWRCVNETRSRLEAIRQWFMRYQTGLTGVGFDE